MAFCISFKEDLFILELFLGSHGVALEICAPEVTHIIQSIKRGLE